MTQPSIHQRIYHGDLSCDELAHALIAAFDQGNLRAQQMGHGDKIVVQVASRHGARSGGQTAITVTIQKHEDGVTVALGEHEWLGVAASLGQTALSALMNPWNLINRLDDLAQDVSSLNLTGQVWDVVERSARSARTTKTLSERLQSVTCPYCGTANGLKEPQCVSCGGPLGEAQPLACPRCGNVMPARSTVCSNCGSALNN